MSILIKGMEIPKKKNGAVLIIYPDGRCAFENSEEYKAVPVPPHGRLGDLDALEQDFLDDAEDEWNKRASPISWADAFDEVADMVADAPTIIEAEEGE